MLLSEIGDKEVIDLTKGSRHGSFWDAEMLIPDRRYSPRTHQRRSHRARDLVKLQNRQYSLDGFYERGM